MGGHLAPISPTLSRWPSPQNDFRSWSCCHQCKSMIGIQSCRSNRVCTTQHMLNIANPHSESRLVIPNPCTSISGSNAHQFESLCQSIRIVVLGGPRRGEGREIRTPNLLIWSQTRYRCAIPPMISLALIRSTRSTPPSPDFFKNSIRPLFK